ncbi:MAG: glutathione S-transferase N-terminal domain-containing protein [Pseudomonadota bacterium]
MIDLYTFGTPNGKKVSIALEEMGLAYTTHTINIMKDEQFDPAFLKISPNNKIPAIVDHETGVSMMESGAILYYLATKTGKFMPTDPHRHWQAIEWLNWQMGGFGPMLGQANHFLKFNPGKSDYAEKRYGDEARRLYGVLDKRLADNAYVAGDDYTIADMAIFPWCGRAEWQKIDLNAFPNLLRWYKAIAARPAVVKGYNVPTAAEIPMP